MLGIDADFLFQVFMLLIILTLVVLLPVVIAVALRDPRKRVEELRGQLRDCRESYEAIKKHYEDEIRRLTRIARPLRSIGDALEEGVVEVRHREDGGRVIALPDGTLVCEKGHVVWPEVEEDGSGGAGVDSG